jgi:hypothetical protein
MIRSVQDLAGRDQSRMLGPLKSCVLFKGKPQRSGERHGTAVIAGIKWPANRIESTGRPLARIGKGQRALNRAHDHREEIEKLLADPWMQRYLPQSFLDWADCQLRKDRFYLFSKDERRIVAEVIEEMKPLGGFAGYSVRELIAVAVLCKSDCDETTEQYIDQLAADQPAELPLRHLRGLAGICRLRMPLPRFDAEFATPDDPGDEEDKRERAEAAMERFALPIRRSA